MSDDFSMTLNDRVVRNNIGKLKAALRSKLISSAVRTALEKTVLKRARKNIRDNNSIFEGTMHKSLSTDVVTARGTTVTVRAGTIGVDYGKNIEEGTPPGATMDSEEFKKLTRWVDLKLLAQRYTTASGRTRVEKYSPGFVLLVAARVAASIKANGIAPVPFLMPAWRGEKNAFYRDWSQRVRNRLKTMFR